MTAAGLPPAEPSAADARRAAVIALAADLFDRGGYASISMEQIAAAAGIAKPTLYHYFRSKDEILRGVHESFIGTLLERQDERVLVPSKEEQEQRQRSVPTFTYRPGAGLMIEGR